MPVTGLETPDAKRHPSPKNEGAQLACLPTDAHRTAGITRPLSKKYPLTNCRAMAPMICPTPHARRPDDLISRSCSPFRARIDPLATISIDSPSGGPMALSFAISKPNDHKYG
jgi:hypothetical protein